jgi:two-component system chemotaxis response regulator CheB
LPVSQPGLAANRPISVLVVDDSVVIRRLVTDALNSADGIEVVGIAANGRIALTKIEQLRPDIVTLDIEMPELNGIETVKELRKTNSQLPVIMFSTLSVSGGKATLDALAAGATDYVTKPANVGSIAESMAAIREQLVPRIRALCGRPAPRPAAATTQARGVTPAPARAAVTTPRPALAIKPSTGKIELLAIGCSTGGPEALAKVLQALPAHFPVPVVVVQHMPPVFTGLFAERLEKTCAITVSEATDNRLLEPGHAYIAPGDHHLEVVAAGGRLRTRLHDGPPECFCRPAVDVLFRSVAAACGGSTLAVVLTGMGHDGRGGAELLRAAGSDVLVQDKATSVVWGMPGAIAEAGLATEILPLGQIAPAVLKRISAQRPTERAGATSWR